MSTTQGQDPESEYGQDTVKVFSNEGDGENTEHLNSMDLHDVKTELVERDAEKAEAAASATTSTAYSTGQSSSSASTSATVQQASVRPILQPHMVYPNGSAVSFMVPPFAGTPIYPVPAGFRPVKMEGTDWAKMSSGGQISIPAYSYPAGFLPVDQSGLRPAYPFMIPGQYITQMPYQQQLTALGNPIAPNAAVHPNSGLITPQIKEKKPHIKKPLNAFMLFMKTKRADVIKDCTLKESAAINQILGKMWHALDRSEQAKYYEMAREERARHMQMYPGWSARDNYAVHKKRRKKKVKQVNNEPLEDDNSEVGDGDRSDPSDPNAARKCRARYGLDQQEMWCGPCRRKKKCIKYSEGDDEKGPQEPMPEGDDDAIEASSSGDTNVSNSGGFPHATIMTTQAVGGAHATAATKNSDRSGAVYQATPTLTQVGQQPSVPLTLRTATAS